MLNHQKKILSSRINIVEQYQNYRPPVDVQRSLRLLLRYVPEQYLKGLHKITVTNSESLRSIRGKITLEKQRIRPADCRGMYSKGEIFLSVDQIFFDCPEVFLLAPPFKTFLIGEVLYHEIGHHIHRLEEPGYRSEKEVVADEWREKLLQQFLGRRYWYLFWMARPFQPLLRSLAARLRAKVAEDEVR
jgi:hypothetical protein